MAQTSENPAGNALQAPALNDPDQCTYAQDGPFAPLPASMGEGDEFSLPGMNELPPAEGPSDSQRTPMVAASTAQLPTPPISDTDLPALQDQQNCPAPIHAQHQGQIGSNANLETTQALPNPNDDTNFDLPSAPSSGTNPGTDLSIPASIQDPSYSNANQSQGSMTNPLRQNSPTPVPVPTIQTPSVGPSVGPSPAPAPVAPAIPTPDPSVSIPTEMPAPAAAPPAIQTEAEADAETAAVREYLKIAKEKIQNGEALEVLRQLSKFYGNPRFTAEESSELVDILVLAATQVIYSQKSFLEPAYVVQPGDSVEKIAAEYNIPQDLIILVNGLQPGAPLQPGTQLKVVRGPFHVLVYLDRHEMILTLNGLFAGRFWIGIGSQLVQKDSDFFFAGKSLTQTGTSPMPCCDFVLDTGEPGSAKTMKIQACNDPNAIGLPTDAILMSQTDVQNLSAILGPKSQLLMRCHSLKPVAQQNASGANPGAVPPSTVPAQAPATAYGSAPAPAYVPAPAPAPAYGSSAELPGALPDSLPDSLPGAAPAPAMAPAEELPLELPATL